jgi:hypothetical protein
MRHPIKPAFHGVRGSVFFNEWSLAADDRSERTRHTTVPVQIRRPGQSTAFDGSNCRMLPPARRLSTAALTPFIGDFRPLVVFEDTGVVVAATVPQCLKRSI